jgi:hypothetical protein
MLARSLVLNVMLSACCGPALAQLSGYNPVACSIQYERTGFDELVQLCRTNPDGGVATGFRVGASSVRCHEAQAWAAQCSWPYRPPPPQARTVLRQDLLRPSQGLSGLPDLPIALGPGYDMSIIGGFRPYDEPLVIDPPRDPRRRLAPVATRLPEYRVPASDAEGRRCVVLARQDRRDLGFGRTENVLALTSSPGCMVAAVPVWAKGSDGRYRGLVLERGTTRELTCITDLGSATPCYGLIEWGEGQAPAD